MSPEWELRLEHERAIRDALVACGNTPPDRPDPEGGLIPIDGRKFNGAIYWPFLEARGHNNGDFGLCKCRGASGTGGPSSGVKVFLRHRW